MDTANQATPDTDEQVAASRCPTTTFGWPNASPSATRWSNSSRRCNNTPHGLARAREAPLPGRSRSPSIPPATGAESRERYPPTAHRGPQDRSPPQIRRKDPISRLRHRPPDQARRAGDIPSRPTRSRCLPRVPLQQHSTPSTHRTSAATAPTATQLGFHRRTHRQNIVAALTAEIASLKRRHRTEVIALRAALEQAQGENLELSRQLQRRLPSQQPKTATDGHSLLQCTQRSDQR
jgi:hypothetical protein